MHQNALCHSVTTHSWHVILAVATYHGGEPEFTITETLKCSMQVALVCVSVHKYAHCNHTPQTTAMITIRQSITSVQLCSCYQLEGAIYSAVYTNRHNWQTDYHYNLHCACTNLYMLFWLNTHASFGPSILSFIGSGSLLKLGTSQYTVLSFVSEA